MSELTKLLLKLSFVIIFMLSVFLMSRPFQSFECNHNRKFLSDTINGVVVQKEKDSFYGTSERVTTKSRNGIFSWEDDFYELRGKAFYDKIAIGDSIVKKEGVLILEIFKSDTTIIIDLSFPCDR